MSEITLESLGLSKEEIINRLIQRLTDEILNTIRHYDEDEDEEWFSESPYAEFQWDHDTGRCNSYWPMEE